MRRLDLDEIRRYPRTYETIITATQIADYVNGWWGSPEIKDNEFNKVFMDGVPRDKVRQINAYVSSNNLVPIGSVEDSDYSGSCFDLSAVFSDIRMNESTPAMDIQNAIMLSNDICYQIVLLHPLIQHLYCNVEASELIELINERCKTFFDKEFFDNLMLYHYTYLHYGKRAAWAYYVKLLKYSESINRLCKEFNLSVRVPEN